MTEEQEKKGKEEEVTAEEEGEREALEGEEARGIPGEEDISYCYLSNSNS